MRLLWVLLRGNWSVKNERIPKLLFFIFRSLTLTCDLWVKFSFRWRELEWGRLMWDVLRGTRFVYNERVPKVMFSFLLLTFTYDLRVKFYFGDEIMINAANLRSFASKSTGKRRNERIPELRFPFSVFLHIDLGQRPLGQTLFWVTRVTVNAVDLRLSARESVGKRNN